MMHGEVRERLQQTTYGNLKVHHLLRKGAHLVVEAEAVFANIVCGEYKVTLALLCAIENESVSGADDGIIDIERTTGLYLFADMSDLVLALSVGEEQIPREGLTVLAPGIDVQRSRRPA